MEQSEDRTLEAVEQADDQKLKADDKAIGTEQKEIADREKQIADRDQALTTLRYTLAAALMKVKSLNASKQQDDQALKSLAMTDANDLKEAGEALKNRDMALKYLKS